MIGLLPVTGIQLPLISAGGTSTATTLFMVGLMANAARHEPDAVAALRAGRDDRMNRLLRLPLPEPYLPSRVEVLRDRLRSRPATPGKQGARPARPAKSAKAPAKSAKAPARSANSGANRTSRNPDHPRDRAVPGGSGHHGSASQQRRVAAARGHAQHGNGQPRRSRGLEGQRYG